MRALDVCRDEWRDEMDRQYERAEEACNGVLLNKKHLYEFRIKFGMDSWAVRKILFRSASHIANRYASEELLRYWETHPKTTFEQWAYHAGFRHKFLLQARRRGRGYQGRWAA